MTTPLEHVGFPLTFLVSELQGSQGLCPRLHTERALRVRIDRESFTGIIAT